MKLDGIQSPTLTPRRTVLVLLPKIYLPFFLLELSEKGIQCLIDLNVCREET